MSHMPRCWVIPYRKQRSEKSNNPSTAETNISSRRQGDLLGRHFPTLSLRETGTFPLRLKCGPSTCPRRALISRAETNAHDSPPCACRHLLPCASPDLLFLFFFSFFFLLLFPLPVRFEFLGAPIHWFLFLFC